MHFIENGDLDPHQRTCLSKRGFGHLKANHIFQFALRVEKVLA